MTSQREAQWTQRLAILRGFEARCVRFSRYDQARKAYVIAQRAYERWATEVVMRAS